MASGVLTDVDCRKPLKLTPNNFTPLTRTPWGGTKIARSYKSRYAQAGQRIGESWEFSCDPAFPSRVIDHDIPLLELIRGFPNQTVAGRDRLFEQGIVLLKILDAASPLSLQVHPEDSDPALSFEECGKPESWLVIDADPGAGLYLGFNRPLTKGDLRGLLSEPGRVEPILQFVPVASGDYFEIAPGVPHAIGPGVTLIEPQRIIPGKSGVTYRMWDWDRKYDEAGQPCRDGQPRKLHIEESLRVIAPESQFGSEFVEQLRRVAVKNVLNNGGCLASFPANQYYQVHRFTSSKPGRVTLNIPDGFAAATLLAGMVSSADGQVTIAAGEPVLLPSQCLPFSFEYSTGLDLIIVIPADCKLHCDSN